MTHPPRRLLALALPVTLAVALAAAPTLHADPVRSLQTAHGLLGRGLYDLAEREYRTALSDADALAPKDAALAAYGLAVCLDRQDNPAEALDVLAGARLNTDFAFAAEAELLTGACLHRVSRHADAAETLDGFLRRHLDHPAAPQAAAMLVESLASLERHDRLIIAARASLDRWPDAPAVARTRLLLGVSLDATDRADEAIAMFRQLASTAEPESDEAALRLARLLESTASAEDPAPWYQRAAASADPDLSARAGFALARRAREANDPRAAAVLRAWIAANPDHPLSAAATIELARALLSAGEPDAARRLLADADQSSTESRFWEAKAAAAGEDPRSAVRLLEPLAAADSEDALHPYVLYDLGAALQAVGSVAEAEARFEQLRSQHPRHELGPHAMYAQAAIALDAERFDEAAAMAARLRTLAPSHPLAREAALILASAQSASGDHRAARRTLESLGDPAPEVRLRLALAQRQAGDPEAAREIFEQLSPLVDQNPSLAPALLALAELAYDRGDWAETITRAEAFLRLAPDHPAVPDATLKLALAIAETGAHADAVKRFDGLRSDTRVAADLRAHAAYAEAASLRALGDLDAAHRLLTAVLDDAEAARFATHARRLLGSIELERGDPDGAAGRFAEAVASDDAEPSDALNLARALLASGRPEDALDALDDGSLRSVREPLKSQAGALRAVALVRAGESARALRLIDEVDTSQLTPDAATRLTYERALALRDLGRSAESESLLLTLQSDNTLADRAALELAALRMEAGDPAAALEPLDLLLARAQELPADLAAEARYRRGVVAHLTGDPARAAELLAAYAEENPRSPVAVSADLVAARSLIDLDRHAEALPHLRRVIDAEPADDQFAPALLLLADAAAQAQRYEESHRAARDHLDRYPDSDLWFRAAFAEGWALEHLGRPADAITAYRAVADRHVGETAARAQFQIGECLFAQGDHERAVAEFLKTDILHAAPEWSAAAIFEAARCFEALQKSGEARAQYRDLLARFPDSSWAEPARARLSALTRDAAPGRGTP